MDKPWPQLLIFEITDKCNRAKEHTRCPSGDADRYGTLDTSRPLDDLIIFDCIEYAYAHGFIGSIGYHFYNEPLLAWPRTRLLITRIRDSFPDSKHILWTNGDAIHQPGQSGKIDPAELSVFNACWISNYANTNWDFLRAHIQLVIDFFGNGHLCCRDWQGTVHIGNIFTDGFPAVVANQFRLRDVISQDPLPSSAPDICRSCTIRSGSLGIIDQEAAAQQRRYITNRPT